jgi:hypothetical protein
MKYILTTIILSTLIATCEAQFRSVGVIAGGGVSAINVATVVKPYILSDWDTYSLVFKGFAEYTIGERKALGLEVGTNRLYYWRYPAPGYSWDDWRIEWTTNAVFYYILQLSDRFYLQSGAGLHHFYSGTVVGLLAACSYSFPVSERFSIPIFFRIEPIFGSATPIAFNIGTGLRYNLIK